MYGMEGAIVTFLLHLVMVAIGLVAYVRDGGCDCHPPLTLGHGCNWACGQCTGWKVPLSPSSCNWSWLQLGLWSMRRMEGAIVAVFLPLIMVATGLVAIVRDGGCHCHPLLALGHGCNWACGQCTGWKVPLLPSSWTWSWLQLGL